MIEFRGQLTGKCKDYMLNREAKFSLIGGSIMAIIVGIFTVIAALLFHPIFFIGLIVVVIVPILSGLKPPRSSYGLILPSRITIENNLIVCEGEKFFYEAEIEDIIKVVDFGEWYQMYLTDKNGRFVCQKSLLVNGTLEEFEKLFDGKIERKI